MKVITKSQLPGQIKITEKEIPQLNKGEILIEVSHCAICGSDIHAVKHAKGYEFVREETTLGHEFSGKVIKVTDEQDQHLVNKNVYVESMHYCGKCENCLSGRTSICMNLQVIGLHYDGGMSEFVKVPRQFVKEINPALPIELAALMEPMAIAVHAVNRIDTLQPNQKVLVQGPGIIGFFTGLISAHKQADVLLSGLDSDYEHRLSKATKFGMKPLIANKEKLEGEVDVLFECSGSSAALKSGITSVKKGGKVVLVALYEEEMSLFLTELVRKEVPLLTSYGCDPVDYKEAEEILVHYQEPLKEVISLFPLLTAREAFAKSMEQDVLKAVLFNE
ncbi:zinc-dependent alcohol dehydrogenase [Halalkalibacter krulwichiae]|uniref:D-arabitol-phosphate dehydrogenase n=1 Tax=Halalkalibacter krulwichiae TaxID=199441 RepID=A0A1X9MML9_9BACI|nr:alcohol dehydrogenase catalytic domain-containing protein [Halalkalibacter krulwichiae]ARK32432.1 D-arabitol-phosphate dehydrogenase [Halalkalibacter krulwichiae]